MFNVIEKDVPDKKQLKYLIKKHIQTESDFDASELENPFFEPFADEKTETSSPSLPSASTPKSKN